jgi:hypothetical protein
LCSGPSGRDKSGRVIGDYYNYLLAPTYYTTLAAGQEFALMIVTSFGIDRTMALSNAAAIDAEPADIFHGKSLSRCEYAGHIVSSSMFVRFDR